MTDLTLFPAGVCSKWGFGDGDVLWDFLDDHDIEVVDEHAVLIELVRRHVAPLFGERVELQTLITIHNPIRAKTIDGREWDDYSPDVPTWIDALPPVVLTLDQVREAIKEVEEGTNP